MFNDRAKNTRNDIVIVVVNLLYDPLQDTSLICAKGLGHSPPCRSCGLTTSQDFSRAVNFLRYADFIAMFFFIVSERCCF